MPNADELGLGSEQWDLLLNQVEDPIFRVKAYRWNPEFVVQDASGSNSSGFDAIIFQDTPYRLNTEGVERLVADEWETVAGYTACPGQIIEAPPSLASDGVLSVFVRTNLGISVNTYDGTDWSGWSVVVTDSSVAFIAAVAGTQVHYLLYDSVHRNYRFYTVKFDGSWTITASSIYWGFQITSFAAKRINGVDVLVFTSETPGVISNKVVNAQVIKQYLPAMGVCVITHKYGTWSDHLYADYLDQWASSRYRISVRLSIIEDTLWLTTYSSESDNGGVGVPITGYRAYSSKDGRHWSRGDHFPVPFSSNQGIVLILNNQTLYCVTNGHLYASPATLRFTSNPDSSTILDITDRVDSLSITRQDMQQISMTLENPDGLTDGTFLDGSCVVAMTIETGFWDAENDEAVYVQQGIFEIDTIEDVMDDPDRMLQISARDRMSWISSKSQSEQFHYWQPQVNVGDEYVDTTNTDYGGMGHTAPVLGSWKTIGNTLILINSNERGQAWTTFLDDGTWNGSIQCYFKLAQLTNGEYAGLLFRSQDKDNYRAFYYSQGDDKLRLVRVSAGSAVTEWASAPMGWSGSLDIHWLRVEFFYSRIRCLSAVAIVSYPMLDWHLEQEIVSDGRAAYSGQYTPDGSLTVVTAPSPDSGYAGVLAKGYHPTESYNSSPLILPAPILPYGYEIEIEAPTEPLNFWALVYAGDPPSRDEGWSSYALYYDGDWGTGLENGVSMGPFIPAGIKLGFQQHGVSDPFNNSDKYTIGDRGLVLVNPRANTFTLLATFAEIFLRAPMYAEYGNGELLEIFMSSARQGWIMVSGAAATVAISTDYGETWRHTFIFSAATDLWATLNMQISEWNGGSDGVIYTMAKLTGTVYRSRDWGETWELTYYDPSYPGITNYRLRPDSVILPLRRDNGVPNVNTTDQILYMMISEDGRLAGDPPALYRSDDAGNTFALVSALPMPPRSRMIVHPATAQLLYYFTMDSGSTIKRLVWSDDGGETWTVATGNAPIAVTRIRVWPHNPDYLVGYNASGYFGEVGSIETPAIYTTDRGETWHTLTIADDRIVYIESEYS